MDDMVLCMYCGHLHLNYWQMQHVADEGGFCAECGGDDCKYVTELSDNEMQSFDIEMR